MVTQNPAFQVLVTSGNQGVAAAGIRPEALLSGQLGVFDYNTGLSVDGSVPSKNKNVFIAVGKAVGAAAGSASTDLMKSAGENIEKAGLRAYTQKPAVAGVDKKVVIAFGVLDVSGTLGVKIEFRSQEAYRNFGNNTPHKSAFVSTPADSTSKDAYNAVIVALGTELLNVDDEGILSVAYLDSGAADAVIAKASILDAVGKVKLQISASATAIASYSNVNLKYLANRLTNIVVAVTDGAIAPVITTTQEMVFPEGTGYDINQKEYIAGGWNGNPGVYRESGIGFAGVSVMAVPATIYDQLIISYENTGIGGGQPYKTSLQTIIAIPDADNTTFTAVENLLNLVLRDISGASTADEISVEAN